MFLFHKHSWLKWSALIEGHGSRKLQFRTCHDCGLIKKRSIGVCDYSSSAAANEVIDQTKRDDHDTQHEAHGLEVVGYVAQVDIDFKGDCTLRISPYSDYTNPVVLLSDATAVIDQLRAENGQLLKGSEIRDAQNSELHEYVGQLRERVAELEADKANLIQQAQIQAQEARTQKSIVLEIGALVGCDKDYEMAGTVRAALKEQEQYQ